MSQVGTGVWRFVGAFPAQSHVDCHPRWALSLPRHTRTATHRQPAHTDVLQEVAVQPNPFCLHKLCPRIRAKYLKTSNLDAFPQIQGLFFLQFVPKAAPENSAGSSSAGLPGPLISHPGAHLSPGDRSAGKTHQAQVISATTPCLWPIFPVKTRRRSSWAV